MIERLLIRGAPAHCVGSRIYHRHPAKEIERTHIIVCGKTIELSKLPGLVLTGKSECNIVDIGKVLS